MTLLVILIDHSRQLPPSLDFVCLGAKFQALRMVADPPWYLTWPKCCELSLGAKFKVCITLTSGRFLMVGDHLCDVGPPSWKWWMTIHGTSPGLNFVKVPNSMSVVHFVQEDFGWWLTIHGMLGFRVPKKFGSKIFLGPTKLFNFF